MTKRNVTGARLEFAPDIRGSVSQLRIASPCPECQIGPNRDRKVVLHSTLRIVNCAATDSRKKGGNSAPRSHAALLEFNRHGTFIVRRPGSVLVVEFPADAPMDSLGFGMRSAQAHELEPQICTCGPSASSRSAISRQRNRDIHPFVSLELAGAEAIFTATRGLRDLQR